MSETRQEENAMTAKPQGNSWQKFRRPRGRDAWKYDWDSVDWTQYDAEIARQLGCWPAVVGRRRARLGFPPSRGQSRWDRSRHSRRIEGEQ